MLKLFLFTALVALAAAETTWELSPDPDGGSTPCNEAVVGRIVVVDLWEGGAYVVPNECGNTCINDAHHLNGYDVTVDAATPMTLKSSKFATLASDDAVFLNSGAMTVAPGTHAKWDVSWSRHLAKRETQTTLDKKATYGDLSTKSCSTLVDAKVISSTEGCVSSRTLLSKTGIYQSRPRGDNAGVLANNNIYTAYSSMNFYHTAPNFEINVNGLNSYFNSQGWFNYMKANGSKSYVLFIENGLGPRITSIDTDGGLMEKNSDYVAKYKAVAVCNIGGSCVSHYISSTGYLTKNNANGFPKVKTLGDIVNGGSYNGKYESKVLAAFFDKYTV